MFLLARYLRGIQQIQPHTIQCLIGIHQFQQPEYPLQPTQENWQGRTETLMRVEEQFRTGGL